MAEETSNPGYQDAETYATNPTGNAPDSTYQEYERGLNSYNLARAGETALLNATVDIESGAPTPSATIDSSGNLLVAKATANFSGIGGEVRADGQAIFTRDSGHPLVLNRKTDDGDIARFYQDNIQVGDLSTTASGGIAIDGVANLILETGGSEKARVDGSGNLLVGKTVADSSLGGIVLGGGVVNITKTSGAGLVVRRNSTDGNLVDFYQDGTAEGSISITGSTTSYNTSSDYRLKENVVPMSSATDRIKALKPSRFNFIKYPDRTVDGFIAHEVAEVVPEAVTGAKDAMKEQVVTEAVPEILDEEGQVIQEAVAEVTETVPSYQAIDESKLVPLLVATIQELEARITALEA